MQKSERDQPGERAGNLFGPVDHPAKAMGAFSDRASGDALIVDADLARRIFFFGSAAIGLTAAFLIGLWVG